MAKVFVGLSGGVDSAVSAALLKEQRYDVTCVFIKIWQPEFIECTWKEDRLDAMRVAVSLDLPFAEIDLSNDYKKTVIDSMIEGYTRGITPNPDVLCNRSIKFGSFLKFAKEQGADFIGTGHYARIRKGKSFELLRGKDSSKDQSYFLHLLDQHDLASTIFPVGELSKKEVRKLARKFKLHVADKPDSQGLCFVGDVTMKDFLGRYIKLQKGDVLDLDGKVIGEHDGAALYTIGQRHGFRAHNIDIQGGPYFVTRTNAKRNIIWASKNLAEAHSLTVAVRKMHWISDPLKLHASAEVQVRYRERTGRARFSQDREKIVVQFEEPRVVSPGQSLVIYDREITLGGGVISEIVH